jgi:hypothetical protein
MSEAISSLGSIFSGGGGGTPSWMKLLLGGLSGAGEIGNIMADRQRGDLLNKEKSWMDMTPQALAAKVSAATKPLDAGLTQGVGNVVQGQVGERGLAESPGVYSAVLSQALAPYYQKNQSDALSLILKQMGIPIESAGLLPGMTQMGPLLALLMKSVQKPTPTQTGSTGGTPDFSQFMTPSATTGDSPDWMNSVFPSTDAGVPA